MSKVTSQKFYGMNGDLMPLGGYRKKAIDPKRVQKIKEGWKKAEEIRKKATEHHHSTDVPAAEEQLLEDLKDL